jgi:hypothetical protein
MSHQDAPKVPSRLDKLLPFAGLALLAFAGLSVPLGAEGESGCKPFRPCTPRGCTTEATCCKPIDPQLCMAAAIADLRADAYGSSGVFDTLSHMSVWTQQEKLHDVADAEFKRRVDQGALERAGARCGFKGRFGDPPELATNCENKDQPFSTTANGRTFTFGADMSYDAAVRAMASAPLGKKGDCTETDPLAGACQEQLEEALNHEKGHFERCKDRPVGSAAALKFDLGDEVKAYRDEAQAYRKRIKDAKRSCLKFRKPKSDTPPSTPPPSTPPGRSPNDDLRRDIAGVRSFRAKGNF